MRLTRATPAILLLAGWILTPALATAASWYEQGDAGDVPGTAQITAGTGTLTQLTGSLPTDADIDMFCFRVTDRAAFFAFKVCAGISEPDLWLFDQNGVGIQLNDGCMFSQTNLSAALVPANGLYYLAVSLSDRDARNPGGQAIWNPAPFGAPRAPDGPGAPGPFASWGGSPFPLGPVTYSIQINGATFCDIPVPTDPATWGTVKSRFVDP